MIVFLEAKQDFIRTIRYQRYH